MSLQHFNFAFIAFIVALTRSYRVEHGSLQAQFFPLFKGLNVVVSGAVFVVCRKKTEPFLTFMGCICESNIAGFNFNAR